MNVAAAATDFRILGPVEAARDGQVLRLGGRRQRALLALLLLEPGRRVSTGRLVEELWAGVPPPGAERTLRVYVSRLRTALGEDRLVARPPGYVLEIETQRVDARRFERLLAEGQEARARGAAGLALDRLGAALALWRGPALVGVADGGALALEAARLEDLRLVCLEERIDADLALGHHPALVSELERLVAEEPLRERFWRQLVTALYRCERQADALDAYRRARALLDEELGLEPSEDLRALERAVLRHEVTRPVPAPERHNLPAQLTSFVGRETELAEVAELSRTHRLVTLTGVGGTGKTRLALEAAARQVDAWTGGVWLVDLSAVTDGSNVPTAVARALGIAERPDVPLLQGLVDQLRTEELLLLVDNCEHLSEACAALVHEILRACTDVRVLATSRIALGVPGEVDLTVGPLPTPSEDTAAEDVVRFPCVRLFLERARAVHRELAEDAEGAAVVARICRELDGLPLAIELAAARAKALSLDEIAERLDDRFRFLRSWRRVADPRHQTLRTTIDWSYDLLSTEEQALLEGLSVFAGGFSLAAAGVVCLDGDDSRALQLVERLVESSLVVAEQRDGATRYRLLETIREYAAERLEELGRAETLRRRHAEHFLDVAREAVPDFVRFSPQHQRAGLTVLDAERENMHAAMRWAVSSQSDLALPLATALRPYWVIRGSLRQGLEWLDQALEQPPRDASPVRAAGLAAAALLARLAGDLDRARRFADEGIPLARAKGPPLAVATCLNVLTTLAGLAGDYDRARAHCDEAVDVARSLGSRRAEAISLFILAEAALHTDRHADLRDVGGRALALSRANDDREGMALALSRLGMGALFENRLPEAASQLSEALEYASTLGFPVTGAFCCDGLAALATFSGDPRRAARLLGAADALRRGSGSLPLPAEARAREEALSEIRRTLAPDDVNAALDDGRRLGLEGALAEAL